MPLAVEGLDDALETGDVEVEPIELRARKLNPSFTAISV